jgi:hypothetical protein
MGSVGIYRVLEEATPEAYACLGIYHYQQILKKYILEILTTFNCHRELNKIVWYFKHSDQPSGSIKLCYFLNDLVTFHCRYSRSQWPRGLRHELSSLARTLGSWVGIQLEA